MANNYYFEKVKRKRFKEKADFNQCIEELNSKLEKANEARRSKEIRKGIIRIGVNNTTRHRNDEAGMHILYALGVLKWKN